MVKARATIFRFGFASCYRNSSVSRLSFLVQFLSAQLKNRGLRNEGMVQVRDSLPSCRISNRETLSALRFCWCDRPLLFVLFTSVLVIQPNVLSSQHYFRNLDWWFDEELLLIKNQHLEEQGGYLYDRDLLRKYRSEMDHEYHLDLSTFMNDFNSMRDDEHSSVRFRNQFRSFDVTRFASRASIQVEGVLSGRHEAVLGLLVQEDLQANRSSVEIGYRYRLGTRHRVGASLTTGQVKPDLDLTFHYEWTSDRIGDFDLRFVALDVANNLIFEKIGVDPSLQNEVRGYRKKPLLFAAHWSKNYDNWTWGLVFGLGPESRSRIHFLDDLGKEFLDKRGVSFLGIEVIRSSQYLGDLLFFSSLHSEHFRRQESRADIDTQSNDRNLSIGYKYKLPLLSLLLYSDFYYDFYRNTRLEEQDEGTFKQHESLVRIGVKKRSLGWAYGARLEIQNRSFENIEYFYRYLRFLPNPVNRRLTFTSGYRFRPDAEFEFGFSLDLDGDKFHLDRGPRRFDGGFGRLMFEME